MNDETRIVFTWIICTELCEVWADKAQELSEHELAYVMGADFRSKLRETELSELHEKLLSRAYQCVDWLAIARHLCAGTESPVRYLLRDADNREVFGPADQKTCVREWQRREVLGETGLMIDVEAGVAD